MSPPIVTFLNQKGGVGKTSTCHHLSGTLALMGLRVLLVDNDPQASLTQGLWGPEATEALYLKETLASVYRGDRPLLDSLARPSGVPGVDLVPGSDIVSSFNVPDPWTAPSDVQLALLQLRLDAAGRYDVVLIDCPPNLHLCSWASLLVATHLVVPLQAEDYGAQGLGPVRMAYQMARDRFNPDLALAGFLVTMFDRRTALARMYAGELRAAYGPQVFGAVVPRLVEFAEAIARRQPVCRYRPKGPAAAAMRAVADELLARLALAPEPSPSEVLHE